MSKTKVTFFETNPFQKKYLSLKLQDQFDLKFVKDPISDSNISEVGDSEIIGIFIDSNISPDVLSKFPKLKLITTMSTGFDHIDLEAAKKQNITVCNVPHYGENTVAEHTFALILAISRRIIDSYKKVKEGIFDPKGLTGFDLRGKTLGVVGCGSIGEHVIKIAKGFDMKVLGYDVNKNEELVNKYDLKYLDLEDLLGKSDIITLHAPYNKHTHHLINKENIKHVKKDAVIINTSRGGLIETDALYSALKNDRIKAVGLDVLEEEDFLKEEAELLYSDEKTSNDMKTVITNHVLINHPRVLVTPHNAFNSKEAIKRILDTTVENVVSFKKGLLENSLL